MTFTRKQWLFLMPTLLMLGLVLLYHFGENPIPFYQPSYHWWNGQLQPFIQQITNLGNPVFHIIYLTIFALAIHFRSAQGLAFFTSYLLIQIGFTLMLVQLLKYGVGAARPYTFLNEYQFLTTNSAFHSFPSGHTAEIVAACGFLAYYFRHKLSVFLLGLVPAIMGFSRIYLGKHYPIDVFCGMLIGMASTALMVYCYPRIWQTFRTLSQYRRIFTAPMPTKSNRLFSSKFQIETKSLPESYWR